MNRIRWGFARLLMKATGLSFVPQWVRTAWSDISFRLLVSEGYKTNAAVWACVRVWARGFAEPELHVWADGASGRERQLTHPARLLVQRPNPAMGEDEFWTFVITYLALGGNCYVWKERSLSSQVVGLWPFHDGQVQPIPGQTTWIEAYEYDAGGSGAKVRLDPSEVIHLRWAPDPLQPTRGLAPLVAAARAVDADNEALRYTYALLKNDAVPRTILTSNVPLNEAATKMLQAQWRERYGGDQRGDIAVISGDISVSRVGSNLSEIAAEAIHNIPESRIAAAFEVPAVLAGLNVGLQRANALGGSQTDSLREFFTESALVPRWRAVAGQFTAGLLPEFGEPRALSMEFDLSQVRAFEDDEQLKRDSVARAVSGGWMTINEARAAMNLPGVSGGDAFIRPINIVAETATVAKALPAPIEEKARARDRDLLRRSLVEREKLAQGLAEEVGAELGRLQERAAVRARRNGDQ